MPRSLLADLLFLPSRRVGDRALDPKERANEAERYLRAIRIGIERFEEVAPAVDLAVDLDDVAYRVEVVVDDVGIGDEEALITGEDVVDGVARMVSGEFEENVPARRDEHPEVARAAALLVLYEHAGCVDAEVRLLERVHAHCGDERFDDVGACPPASPS